jgi:hypothetical protein
MVGQDAPGCSPTVPLPKEGFGRWFDNIFDEDGLELLDDLGGRTRRGEKFIPVAENVAVANFGFLAYDGVLKPQ